jgi:hypothetical protein
VPVTTLHYAPHEGQDKLHEARRAGKKRIVAQVGRRWGKGRFGVADLADAYDEVLNQHRPPTMVPPFHSWLLVPNYPQARQPWNEMLQLMPAEWIVNKPTMNNWTIELRGNANWQHRPGIIEIKSAFEPDGLQTTGIDHLWISESQDVPNEAFEKVLPVSRSPGVLGWQYWEGIPATYPEHWFEKAFAEAGRNRRHFAYHGTTFESPLLTPDVLEEIESDRDVLSALAWRRMYLALYDSNAGFFQNIDACIAGDVLDGPVPGRDYVAGLDIGWTNDPSVMIILDREARKVVAHHVWDGSFKWAMTREHILGLHELWDFKNIVFDASSGGGVSVTEDLEQTSLPIEPYAIVRDRRGLLLERLAGAIMRPTLHFPPIPQLLRELRAMQMRRQSSGRYRLEVPRGEHDDYIFALALGLTSCVDPHPPEAARSRVKSDRYAPTQAEADGRSTTRTNGAKLLVQRRSDRMRQRAEEAGVVL